MDAQIQAKLDELGRTVAAFKEANDRSIEEIKKNGAPDAVTIAAVEKANKGIETLKDELKAISARSDDLETRLNRPNLGGEGGKQAEDLRAAAKKWFNAASDGKITEASDEQVKEYGNVKAGFGNYLRQGENSAYFRRNPEIFNSMSVGSNPDGGFWAPTEMLNAIVKRIFETSPMRQICDVITISAADVEFPKDVVSGTSGGWVGETGARAATATPTVGMQKIPTHEQYAMPEVTQKFLDDAAIDVEAWLSAKIADIITRTENTAFTSGTGAGQPMGILSYGTASTTDDDKDRDWGILQYVPTGASAAFPLISGLVSDDGNSLISIVHKLKQVYRGNAQWLMNRNTIAAIRKLRDAHGRYLWQDSLLSGQPDRLLNYPVVEGQDMPEIAANSFSVAFGNFSLGYRIVDRIGLRVLRDPFTNKPFVRFYTTKRVGGDVVNFDAIKLLKFAAS